MNNPLEPLNQLRAEVDLAKKILRNINDTVRVLDDVRGRAQTISHLFSPNARILRSKLHELCSRYIWTDPLVNSKRGEETLWKKAYHDVFITAKRLKKEGDRWDDEDSSLMRGLLLSGIGYYQHFIFRLQADYLLHLEGIVDFSMTIPDDGLSKGKTSGGKSEESKWADEMVAHCLLYMGDLSRYLRDFEVGWDLSVAERYYTQAAWLLPASGRPHNQLGTLAASKNYSLDAVYHYMRSITCAEAFPGAESNLTKVLEKNWTFLELEPLGPMPTSPAQKTITRFLLLVDIWFCGRHVNNVPEYCSEVVDGFHQLIRPAAPASVDAEKTADLKISKVDPTNNISTSVCLMMFSSLFMCWERLKTSESADEAALTATLLALMDVVIKEIVGRCNAWKAMRKKLGTRRRRRRRHDSDASSATGSGDSPTESDIESGGDSPQVSSDEGDILNGEENGTPGNWVTDSLLSVLSTICQWLKQNSEVVAKCPTSVKPVTANLLDILNKLRILVPASQLKYLEEIKKPLPEDAFLRGCQGLNQHHDQLNWASPQRRQPQHKEVMLRIFRIVKCGEHLPGIRIDQSKIFHLVEEVATPPPAADSPSQEGKGKLMKNMGQLWLKAEVKELESRMKRINGDYSPYLVVDFEALTEHVALIKQLVGSRHFIVVIPSVVLTQLDECKKSSCKARETIRWLESQFSHGNRNLRSQKAQEKLPLGVIKYPKKKDKEAWNFFQIMECCTYFSKQSELRSKGGATVTFLAGNKDWFATDLKPGNNNNQDFSPSGLASTFGVTLEHVETFHGKWKLSTKSRG